MCAAVKINRLGKFDLNPRGNLWLKDENRFGHKLLSKMGWSQGKGLGKNEDGIAENVKVRMKSGNTGVGWMEKIPLASEGDEYDVVLANLNEKFKPSENKTKKEEDLKSLEIRSQQFKNRLHYGKFVRGKDVCRYSEKDMNSIFVVKKPKPEPALIHVKSTVTNIESSSSEDDIPKTMPIYKSQMSMKEYFEIKMKKKPDCEVLDLMNLTETEGSEELSTKKEILSKKKSKNKRPKSESEILEPCKGEMSDRCINAMDAEDGEELSSKRDSLSRKRNRAAENTEKTKKPKLDSETESTRVHESDCVAEASCSSKIPQTISRDEEPREMVRVISERKKKKAARKKKVKAEVDVSEESTSPEACELRGGVNFLGESPPSEVSGKKVKKPKSGKFAKLRTCLRGSTGYNPPRASRRVSFNEHVFYRRIAGDDPESDGKPESANDCGPGDSVCSPEEKEESVGGLRGDTESSLCPPANGESRGGDELNTNEGCEDEMPSCMDLPKCDNSNYNSWLENQRLATKMRLYQNMIKKIKKHPILKTSNLLDLKGYGNWGF